MKKQIIGNVLQIPLILVVIVAFFASIYAISNDIYPVSKAVPFLIILAVVLYFVGSYLKKRKSEEKFWEMMR